MDFFFWGYVKEKVYQVAPTTRENNEVENSRGFPNNNT